MKSLSLNDNQDVNFMDISSEKAEVMKQVEQIHDISLVRAVKNLLDFGLAKQEKDDALEASIDKGLDQSRKGETRPHDQVMREIRERYKG